MFSDFFFFAAVPLTCVSVTHSAATNSYEVNANHTTTHALCRVIRMEEVNAGDPYTLTVDLFNVIGGRRVNFGHPGVMYNVIDGNNFDFVYFRFVLCCLRGGRAD